MRGVVEIANTSYYEGKMLELTNHAKLLRQQGVDFSIYKDVLLQLIAIVAICIVHESIKRK